MDSSPVVDLVRLRAAYEQARDELLAERTLDGHWVGELSSSALATATAVSALAVVRGNVGWDQAGSAAAGPPSTVATVGRRELRSLVPPYDLAGLIRRGVAYLVTQQNDDGGFGDTDLSHSNIATTMLVVAALHLAGVANEHLELLERADAYIDSQGRMDGLRKRYGIDKTFVVPIMTNLALAGLFEWREIDPLPFELACVPQSLYRFVGMPVVSYAIPALVAIGQAHYHHAPPRNPINRLIRWLSITRSLKVLRRMQPDSGGYLEATPLTSFVVMSLASIAKPRPVVAESGPPLLGRTDLLKDQRLPEPHSHAENSQTATTGRGFDAAAEVIREGVKFLANSIRPDGSWPIDTNLATWNTTLAINALAGAGEDVAELLGHQCLDWLLSCQHLERHPFTGADPGGFGWCDLSGAVPDADDTAGAILALSSWRKSRHCDKETRFRIAQVMCESGSWLHGLRNEDGGWPTFCRGWGKLPFDRSGSDLSAHASRAFFALRELFREYDKSVDDWFFSKHHYNLFRRFMSLHWRTREKYLRRQQRSDGSWVPLWFGNQDHPREENAVYGTAKVLLSYTDEPIPGDEDALGNAVEWLVATQNADGGWGSGVWEKARAQYKWRNNPNPKSTIQNLKSSVEETALAVESLLAACPTAGPRSPTPDPITAAVQRGLAWLVDRVERGEHRQPAPIGFYFAKLWYYERLYPLTFTAAALGRACRQFARTAPTPPTGSQPGDPRIARA